MFNSQLWLEDKTTVSDENKLNISLIIKKSTENQRSNIWCEFLLLMKQK